MILASAAWLLFLGVQAADLRVGLHSIQRPRRVTVNGEQVQAPVDRRWTPPVRFEGIRLDGALEIKSSADGRLRIIHTISLETYVAGVLAGEASAQDPDEYLKALAVAIRTYAIGNQANHTADGFHLCDSTHCQDLRLAALSARHRAIAEETAGIMLWRNGKLADALYHAHCGGQREGAGPDAFCTFQGNESWQTRTNGASIQILERTATGRVKTIRFRQRVMTGEQFVTAWNREYGYSIKSLLFDVAGDRITGRGRGHGRGLCQTGARRMASLGKSYKEILAYYYPGAVTGLNASGLDWQLRKAARVDLLSTQPDRDAALLPAAEHALAEAEQRAGMRMRQRVRLQVYPAVAAFRDATGVSGAIAAVAKGHTIHLQPSAARVLPHEMLHVILEENKARAGQPWWFQEGLAQVLAGDTSSREKRYEEARTKVLGLIRRHGRDAVLGFWQQGLPDQVAGER